MPRLGALLTKIESKKSDLVKRIIIDKKLNLLKIPQIIYLEY